LAVVRLASVSKRFGPMAAVDNISLEVADGEFVALVGPSGCGKSTTLRMVAGLESLTDGEIWIGDRLANTIHPADRDVAMVFQNYALYPHMSVYNNIAYGLKRRGFEWREIEARVGEASALLQLGDLLDRRPAQLSGGQRQRVALGRAIVRRPAVFLMDEPLSNLDAQLRVGMRAELLRLHAKLGITTIYVTHDQVEAMTMAQRVVVMNKGKVEQAGPPLDLYLRPETIFVARFLGTPPMNFIEGGLERTGAGLCFTGAGLSIELPGRHRVQPVICAIRPQRIHAIGMEGRLPAGERLGTGLVEIVEHYGAESFATLSCAGKSLTVSIAPTARVMAGAPLELWAEPSACLFFDPETGRRLDPGDLNAAKTVAAPQADPLVRAGAAP
jgi:ABC-type sugar transport system ATPase subunit